MKKISKGDKCPDFKLLNQDGVLIDISTLIGEKILVIYFYPKDNSWGCTKQACSFQESQQDFIDLDCTVIGISSDSVLSHKTFSDERRLKFMLLSDMKDEVRNKFGVPASFFGLIKGRVTYVIDKKGIVQGVYNSQINSTSHIPKAIEIIKSLK
jgi:peroxiredoxin Q/BCP